MKKQVLLIVHHYPPIYRSEGHVRRAKSINNFLKKSGFDVYIISLFSVSGKSDMECKSGRFTDKLRHFIMYCYVRFVLDQALMFRRKYYEEARRYIIERGVENVIISSPPHSLQLVGFDLKREFGNRVNLIVDYRDSWNTTAVFRRKYNIFLNFYWKRVEKNILRSADSLTSVSHPICEKVRDMLEKDVKAKTIMTGFNIERRPKGNITGRGEYMKIGYFGHLSKNCLFHRDPDRILRAFSEADMPIELYFYGKISLSPRYKRVFVYKEVNPDQALKIMLQMDMLLMIHTESRGSDEVIQGKLFEYMLAERPVLLMGIPGMEAERIIREEGIGYFADSREISDMVSVIKNLYSLWKEDGLIKYSIENLQKYDREKQFSEFLKLLR